MLICIFEDEFYRRLLPLAQLKPAYDLRCGQTTLREKIERAYHDADFLLHTRDYLKDAVKVRHPSSYVNEIPRGADRMLLINGRILFRAELVRLFAESDDDIVYSHSDTILAAWLSGKRLEAFGNSIAAKLVSSSDFPELKRDEIEEIEIINYPWDLVHRNGAELLTDFLVSTEGRPEVLGEVYDGAHLLNRSQIHVGRKAKIKPGAVLDAENGPIYISDDVEVMPNAVICGPAFVGKGSLIKAGAKIYENTSIGEMCKVGGEVEGSIVHAYSNKQHEGFVGHSYLGEWVNIGADSNTSDLKNDYGTVRVYNDGLTVDSGLRFVGLTMGDHSKCGINSMFNTGTVVDVCCNIYGSGSPPKYLPAFSWGEAPSKFVTYRLDKAIDVARKVMARRNVTMNEAEERLLRKVFELTEKERETSGVRA